MILNTHLDNDSEEQRQLGASLVLARARYEAAQNRGIIIVTGDFNRWGAYFFLKKRKEKKRKDLKLRSLRSLLIVRRLVMPIQELTKL